MTQNYSDNALYEMDNLEVLRGMNSETVDLIATDPPFNIKRNRAGTAGFYVDNWKWGDTGILPDQWKWNEVHPKWLEEIKDNHTALYHAIDAAKHCQGEDTAAFLCFLSVRLIEMHRILKDTGSLYLHCDPTASHYIKMCLDAIFGRKNFRNEIVWKRTERGFKGSQYSPNRYNSNTDSILFYAKMEKAFFDMNAVLEPYTPEYIEKAFKLKDDKGPYYLDVAHNRVSAGPRPNLCYKYKEWFPPYPSGWKVGMPRMEELDRQGELVIKSDTLYRKIRPKEGRIRNNLWNDIDEAKGKERTGSPDQKPLALYERIIQASSNEGDLVLDPFCGCATTIIAANNLKRRWIGIDRRVDARYHIVTRMMGITKKDRERLEKHAIDKDWLERQTAKYEIHYQTAPPVRTDEADPDTIRELPHVYTHKHETLHTHADMKQILVDNFGLKCWGCNHVPPDERYLHLDHVRPKSEGGNNDIDNRALLCQPCNSKKSDKMSLAGLRKANKKDGHEQPGEPIDLKAASAWTRDYLIKTVRETPYQRPLPIESEQ